MTGEELRVKLAKYRELRDYARELDRKTKLAKQEADQYQAQLFSEMTAQELDAVKHQGVSYSLRRQVFGHVQDQELFHEWCAENDMLDIFFKDREVKARINELVRECYDTGKELPPGITAYPKEMISITDTKG